MSKPPVAFIIFNRPDTTQRVFERIRAFQPTMLHVIADGPRASRPDEASKCRLTRQIIDGVDWDCDVVRDYSSENMGCKRRVASGITRLFERVEEAIILEDDCLPDPTFFTFCTELLKLYRTDRRIMAVCGTNPLVGRRFTMDSYYFSRLVPIWGWATWRRAWNHYDVDIKTWPGHRDTDWLLEWLGDSRQGAYWHDVFDMMHANRNDTWDFQWAYSLFEQRSLSAIPSRNLVKNLGFGPGATHTTGARNTLATRIRPMQFPLKHPRIIQANAAADAYGFDRQHTRRSLPIRVLRKLIEVVRNRG